MEHWNETGQLPVKSTSHKLSNTWVTKFYFPTVTFDLWPFPFHVLSSHLFLSKSSCHCRGHKYCSTTQCPIRYEVTAFCLYHSGQWGKIYGACWHVCLESLVSNSGVICMKPHNEVLKYFMSRKLDTNTGSPMFLTEGWSLCCKAAGTDVPHRLTGAKEPAVPTLYCCSLLLRAKIC